MADSVFTDAKVLDWKLPNKIESVYNSTLGNKWIIGHDNNLEMNQGRSLPRGNEPLQLYSLATPNGE